MIWALLLVGTAALVAYIIWPRRPERLGRLPVRTDDPEAVDSVTADYLTGREFRSETTAQEPADEEHLGEIIAEAQADAQREYETTRQTRIH